MRSDLRQTSLSTILRHLYSERRSGILHVSRHTIQKRVHLREGAIIFADNGDAESTPSRERAQEIMFSLFTWTSGDVVFEDWETNISEALAFESLTAELILEATRAIDDDEILGRLLGTQESIFACTQTTELPLFKMRLSPAESSVLTFARQRKQFQRWDLPRVSGELPLMRALNTLVSVGLLEIREKVELPEPEPPPMPEPPMQQPAPPPAQVVSSTPEPAAPTSAAEETWSPAPVPDAQIPAPAAPAPWSPDPVQFPDGAASLTPEPHGTASPPARDDVEKLLDAYENKRARETGRHLPPQHPAPTPTPPNPPMHNPAVDEPQFQTMSGAPSPVANEPQPPQVYEPTPPPAGPDETPLPTTSLPPPSPVQQPAAPKVRLSERLGALMPKGKGRVIAASVALGLAALVAVWLVWGGDSGSEPDPVVSASTKEPPPEPPPEPAPPPDEPEDTSEFLEADLFYRANVAFGEEDYEQAKIELEALLGLKPEFKAAELLLDKVNLELEPPEPEPAPKPKPKRRPKRKTARKPPPPPSVEPTGPDPAELFAEAQLAFGQGDIETAEAKLEELRALDPSYAQAAELVAELAHARWLAKLPLSYSAKHDHKFGSCDGVITLNADGIGFTSESHSWSWPFAQLARTERRDSKQLRIVTTRKKKFNFDLRDPIQLVDWSKFLNLAN